jgi:hypothetical protein
MKSLLAFGILFFALSFCGITDKIKESIDSSSTTADPTIGNNTDTANNGDGKTDATSDGDKVEKPNPSAEQQKIIDSGKRVVWDDQGMGWVLPDGWNKMSVSKKMFNYGSPATGFLIVNISSLGESFPVDISLKAFYDGQMKRKNDGEVDLLRYLEIDNVKGIEFIEAMPEDKGDPRRYQWIGYRNYNNQVQMVNVIISTSGDKFNDKSDTFGAILYSMKFDN